MQAFHSCLAELVVLPEPVRLKQVSATAEEVDHLLRQSKAYMSRRTRGERPLLPRIGRTLKPVASDVSAEPSRQSKASEARPHLPRTERRPGPVMALAATSRRFRYALCSISQGVSAETLS